MVSLPLVLLMTIFRLSNSLIITISPIDRPNEFNFSFLRTRGDQTIDSDMRQPASEPSQTEKVTCTAIHNIQSPPAVIITIQQGNQLDTICLCNAPSFASPGPMSDDRWSLIVDKWMAGGGGAVLVCWKETFTLLCALSLCGAFSVSCCPAVEVGSFVVVIALSLGSLSFAYATTDTNQTNHSNSSQWRHSARDEYM